MARIRTIKPECWKHTKIRSLSRDGRLFWVVLVSQADDEGRFQFLPAALIGEGYPADDDVTPGMVRQWMAEVESAGLAVTYEASGDRFGELHHWRDHQKISKPTSSRFPGHPGGVEGSPGNPGEVIEGSISPEFIDDSAPLTGFPGIPRDSQVDLGSRTTDLGPGISGGGDAGAMLVQPHVAACLRAGGFAADEIELDASRIRATVSRRQPPADLDWDALGQKIALLRREGKIQAPAPSASLAFVFNGFTGLPRISSPATAGLFQSTTGRPADGVQRAADRDAQYEAALQAAMEVSSDER